MPMKWSARIALAVIVATWLVAFPISPAIAQTCNFTISNMSFGSVDILAAGAVDTTATINVSCTGTPLLPIRICPSIGAGSGGADASARYMTGPSASTLAYQLYTDAARTTVWGSNYWAYGGTVPDIDLTLSGGILSGSGTASATIYGRLLAGQSTAPPGSYISNFTATDDLFYYGYNTLGIISCDNLSGLSQHATPTFTVTASIAKNCTVSAQNIDFGTQGLLTANIDAQGSVTATCTDSTPYTIGLDNGLHGTAPTARKMSSGSATVTYGIYLDSGHSQPWGNTTGSLQSGTGSGLAQTYTTYGRVPPQTTPAPATYSDTVVVTLTY
jgi:spore coat protein U domain-containing protein, fimbrial subunit CupE1/2/3/6